MIKIQRKRFVVGLTMKKIKSFISNKHFFTFMMSGFLLVSVVFIFFIYQNYISMDLQRKQLDQLSNDIRAYDLRLTNCTLMFILSGNRTYYQDYIQTNDEFDERIKLAQENFPPLNTILQELLVLNTNLVKLEIEAMDTQNSTLFSDADYNQQKEIYEQKSINLQDSIKQLSTSTQRNFISTFFILFIIGGSFITFIIVVTLYLAHRVQKRYSYNLYLQQCTDSLIGIHEDFSDHDLSCLYPIIKNEFAADYVGVININEHAKDFWGQGSIKEGQSMSHELVTILNSSNYPKNILVVDDKSIYPAFNTWLKKYHCKSCWIVQKNNNLRNVVLFVMFQSKSKRLDPSIALFLQELTDLLLLTLMRMKHEEELFTLATTDALTGINNRRMFKERLVKEKKRHKRFSMSSCLMVLDLDHFKEVNDTHGHDIGDMVLIHFVNSVQTCLRDIDIIGRIGGEEFSVFLPSTTIKQAYNVAQRILAYVNETPFMHQNIVIPYTVSIGVTSIINQSIPIEDDLKRADFAMYKAKSHGRNRIEIA